jgi:hypothetical protein
MRRGSDREVLEVEQSIWRTGGADSENNEAGRREPSVAPRPRPRASEEGAGKV